MAKRVKPLAGEPEGNLNVEEIKGLSVVKLSRLIELRSLVAQETFDAPIRILLTWSN
jgi:hypothetical protein